MTFEQLSKNLLTKIQSEKLLQSSDYPSSLVLDSKLVNSLKSLSSYTNNEAMFSRQSGAVGWEYGFSTLFFIDSIYLSEPQKGGYESVNISHNFSAKPVYRDDNKYAKFEIELGKRKYVTRWFKSEELQKMTNQGKSPLPYGFVASFHTHPKYYHQPGTFQYTFFSAQDIASLLQSRIPINGMVAGSDVWLACKTDEAQMIPMELLHKASEVELNQDANQLNKFVKENLKQFGIVFYSGRLGGRLHKV